MRQHRQLKGVMHTHYNIGSNMEQLEQVFGLGRRDCVPGGLPFFHSLGFAGTLSGHQDAALYVIRDARRYAATLAHHRQHRGD